MNEYNTKDKWTRGYDKFKLVPKTINYICIEHTPCYDNVLSNNADTQNICFSFVSDKGFPHKKKSAVDDFEIIK